jgi:hypothetical protein
MSNKHSFEPILHKIDHPTERSPSEKKQVRSDDDFNWRTKKLKSPENKRNWTSRARQMQSLEGKRNRTSSRRCTEVPTNPSKKELEVANELIYNNTIIPNLNRYIVCTKFWSGAKDKVSLHISCKHGIKCTQGLACEFYHDMNELDHFNRKLVQVVSDQYSKRIKEL